MKDLEEDGCGTFEGTSSNFTCETQEVLKDSQVNG